MKLAVVGKGGVGKTTVAGTLARLIGRDGNCVLAVDADPNYNLWSVIGIDENRASQIVPLLNDETLVHDRTRSKIVRVLGDYFSLNPRVDDIAEKFAVDGPDNVRLLVAGTVTMGDSGCMCPSAALLKSLIQHLALQEDETLIMDMDAGIENMGRGTTKGMDALLVVVEPGRRSLETLVRIEKLATDIGTDRVFAVGNRVDGESDRRIIEEYASEHGVKVIAHIPVDRKLKIADLKAIAPLDMTETGPAIEELKVLRKKLGSILNNANSN
jgi:CO dehydrogenase maturation factor